MLGWDCKDQLYDNVKYTGWHTGYPDAPVRMLPDSCRPLPFEDDRAVLPRRVRAAGRDGVPARHCCAACSSARRTMGFEAYAGFEYEFFVFKETPESVREKNYRDLTPMAPGWFGYSVIRNSVGQRFLPRSCSTRAARWTSASKGCTRKPVPACIEAAIAVDKALAAADKAALFKTFTKVLAQTQRPDGDVHGEVVEGLAGPERPHPPVAASRKRRQAGVPRRGASRTR